VLVETVSNLLFDKMIFVFDSNIYYCALFNVYSSLMCRRVSFNCICYRTIQLTLEKHNGLYIRDSAEFFAE
jgi:hypothetical protein